MPEIEIKVTGLKEVRRALFNYSRQLGDKVVIDALKSGLKVIQKEARRRAPRRTGRLRRGIVIRKSKKITRRRTPGRLGVYLTLRKGKGVPREKDAFYGVWIEDGWNVHGKRRHGGRRRGVRATFPGKRDIPGREYIKGSYAAKRTQAINTTVAVAQRAAEIVARRTGLK